MHNFFISLVCCFVPNRRWRRQIRKRYKHVTIYDTPTVVAHMPKSQYSIPPTNKIFIDGVEYHDKIPGMEILITGTNNHVYLSSGMRFELCKIHLHGNGAKIRIGKSVNLILGLFVHTCCGNNQKLEIGDNFSTHGTSVFLNEGNTSLTIGTNGMFSSGVTIWPTDGHTILDQETKQVLNFPKPVIIGDNVWMGQGSRVQKNAHIPSNTIIGAGSVVAKEFIDENTVICGNPARVVKRGIIWDRDNPTHYAQTHTEE